jgi:hypothetical protein
MKGEIFPWNTTDTFLFADAAHRNIRSSADQPSFATSEPLPPFRIAISDWNISDIFFGVNHSPTLKLQKISRYIAERQS